MSKSIKLKCSDSTMKLFFEKNRLYKGKIDDDGVCWVEFAPRSWHKLNDKLIATGETTTGEVLTASFVKLKTKTIKCTGLDHSNPTKKTFKVGKRYQIEQGRPLGAVAGYVYDDNGDRFTLYREDIGYSVACGLATFESIYK